MADPIRSNPSTFDPKVNGTDYFWYTTRVTGLQSTAPTATGIINTDSDSDFYCVALSYQADIAGAVLTESTNILPLVNIQIVDNASGKALMNTPTPIPAIMGDGKRPYRLARPRVFMRNATIQCNFVSFVAAGTIYNISVVLHGYKVYS
jgi:hypothetical protein